MKIEMHESIKAANRVLAAVRKLAKQKKYAECGREVDVYVFSNGREQGYTLHKDDSIYEERSTVSFAENRSSDDIVVYPARGSEHSVHRITGTLTDVAYANRRFFQWDDAEGAARYILNFLTDGEV
jgi:hypothetical protein